MPGHEILAALQSKGVGLLGAGLWHVIMFKLTMSPHDTMGRTGLKSLTSKEFMNMLHEGLM